jgi:hypothetical protein
MPKMTSGTHTQKSLKTMAKRLRDAATLLQAVGDSLEDHGFKSVTVNYHTQTLAGVKTIEKFAAAAHEAVEEMREDRGEYGTRSNGKE